MESATEIIEIRPGSDVYATYRRLDYKAWYAIAEFVDNSTQNFFDHREELQKENNPPFLTVDIVYEGDKARLTISDDAYGMSKSELRRAIQLHKPPPGVKHRSEFGMGLKTAACWLGSCWSVTTKQLHSTEEYTVSVDVDALAEQAPESIVMAVRTGRPAEDHYTRLEITGLFRRFHTNTLKRIGTHLASMYRMDIASKDIAIRFMGNDLEWGDLTFLSTEEPDGTRHEWKKDITFTVGNDQLSVTGWVGILARGYQERTGFHLFRWNRLIVGGPWAGYKPHEIFGTGNTYQIQRLVGELRLDGWPVTHTKDAFDWEGELENELIVKLKEAVQGYIDQARSHRARPGDAPDEGSPSPTAASASLVVDRVAGELGEDEVDEAVVLIQEGPVEGPDEGEPEVLAALEASAAEPLFVKYGEQGMPTAKVWALDNAHWREPYMSVQSPQDDLMIVIVNLKHPFVREFVGDDMERLHLYLHLLLADAFVEQSAHRRGTEVELRPHVYRAWKDTLLRTIKNSQASF